VFFLKRLHSWWLKAHFLQISRLFRAKSGLQRCTVRVQSRRRHARGTPLRSSAKHKSPEPNKTPMGWSPILFCWPRASPNKKRHHFSFQGTAGINKLGGTLSWGTAGLLFSRGNFWRAKVRRKSASSFVGLQHQPALDDFVGQLGRAGTSC